MIYLDAASIVFGIVLLEDSVADMSRRGAGDAGSPPQVRPVISSDTPRKAKLATAKNPIVKTSQGCGDAVARLRRWLLGVGLLEEENPGTVRPRIFARTIV
jgi:hypothetical protein